MIACKDSKSKYEESILIGEDSKVITEQRGEWNPTKREYIYTDDSCSTKFYVDDNLLRTSNYYRGKETTSVQEQYQETGKLIMKIDFNAECTEGLSKTEIIMDGEVTEEKTNGVVTRKYCSAGYADYESRKPYNQTVGPYSETVVEILDSAEEVTKLGF